MTPDQLESSLFEFVSGLAATDPAHDLSHTLRVVGNAKRFALQEHADLAVVIPAAWLHDCVTLPKDAPDKNTASQQAAATAVDLLRRLGCEDALLAPIRHAIEAHSHSAGIAPETLEARVVQDADRIDALGAIGVARCCLVGGALGNPLYHLSDPFCEQRQPDDSEFCIDHFYQKLFPIAETLHTGAARREAANRIGFMHLYIAQLKREL
ncbi:HD domain-containing protein [Exilibacterium tricleocarpae]|uniref:HD domain-containing protein n=1 Tax=Exilibacterium tricleocarpae TaxID=2591008 RepID=A0A545STA1_9GAMM|nr:HD domain-containing protein [Exilibacterium tricleocarpae]